MRILYFSPHPTHDTLSDVGYSTHQREMISALEELGHEVLPVIVGNALSKSSDNGTFDYTKPSSKRQKLKKWIPKVLWQTIKDFQMFRHGKAIAKPMLERAIKEFNPDVIYERSEILLAIGVEAAKANSIPHIYELNGPGVEEMIQFEGPSLLNSFTHSLEVRKFKLSDNICVVSTDLGKYIQDKYNVSESKITVIPNAFNPKVFPSIDIAENGITRDSLGISGSNLVFGFVGSILPFHGVDLLIDAFTEVHKEYVNARLVIVGSGMSLEQLKQKVLENEIADKVTFTGQVSHQQVHDFVKVMDVAIMAKSNWYGSPVKIFEYGAMKKAVIAPNVGPVRDVMKDGVDGILVEPETKELVQAMIKLAKDSSYRDRLANNFHQKVMDKHTWLFNAKNVEGIINKIVS